MSPAVRVAAAIAAIVEHRRREESDLACDDRRREGLYRPPTALRRELEIATAERAAERFLELDADHESEDRTQRIALLGRIVDEERAATLRAAGIL